ncbi:CST complex subunit Ten1 [Xylariaceae sp. FL1272]|nr:CST complex subunit Ten1 [Xylariaceae sp. FL1272]
MSSAPLPSERCLLSKLCAKQIGDKVRFMGCVEAYSTKSAQLTLKHNCPKENNEVAKVDVKLLLGTLKAEQTDVGQWIHVVGYITALEPSPKVAARKVATCKTGSTVNIQALLVWTAQDLNIERYERSMLAEAG